VLQKETNQAAGTSGWCAAVGTFFHWPQQRDHRKGLSPVRTSGHCRSETISGEQNCRFACCGLTQAEAGGQPRNRLVLEALIPMGANSVPNVGTTDVQALFGSAYPAGSDPCGAGRGGLQGGPLCRWRLPSFSKNAAQR
jgi:hypothetical protein